MGTSTGCVDRPRAWAPSPAQSHSRPPPRCGRCSSPAFTAHECVAPSVSGESQCQPDRRRRAFVPYLSHAVYYRSPESTRSPRSGASRALRPPPVGIARADGNERLRTAPGSKPEPPESPGRRRHRLGSGGRGRARGRGRRSPPGSTRTARGERARSRFDVSRDFRPLRAGIAPPTERVNQRASDCQSTN